MFKKSFGIILLKKKRNISLQPVSENETQTRKFFDSIDL